MHLVSSMIALSVENVSKYSDYLVEEGLSPEEMDESFKNCIVIAQLVFSDSWPLIHSIMRHDDHLCEYLLRHRMELFEIINERTKEHYSKL